MQGDILHEWKIDWFDIWPDAQHISEKAKPKSRPGTHIHGIVLLENGDIIFNFESLGLVRMDIDGKVVWKLPYQTHHSVHMDENGDLWVCGKINHKKPVPRIPNYKPTFGEYTALKVSQEGKILKEISAFDLLQKNNLSGLLYMGTLENESTKISGDTLHLNDVEPFPMSMEEGFFKHGDIMISLRNINTVIVFDKNEKVKHVWTGSFIRQHDPDFISGNKISLFDNNNLPNQYSRIIILSAPDNTIETYYSGTEESPFFTNIMGKHQWLPNNNLLITESMVGRAFEITPEGRIVWEYNNLIGDKLVGIMEEAQRIPGSFSALFAKQDVQSPNRP